MSDTPDSTWEKWNTELEAARKAKGFTKWQTRARKIVERYRDERAGNDSTDDGRGTGAKFNILWANVQTLTPALFAKTPKPVVERRYLDRDDVGRTASVILERALLYELDNGSFSSSQRKAVQDRLLPGRGVVWVRYEPKFSPMSPAGNAGTDDATGPGTQGDTGNAGANPVAEQVASESVPVDYVDWMDFGTNAARTWEEVWYLWKRVYMTRKELKARFGKLGEKVPLDWTTGEQMQPGSSGPNQNAGSNEGEKRARVLEIWDKTDRKVYWMAEKWSDAMLDEKDDPLQLEGFWPIPKPLYATLTNNTLVPIPDFVEYQDQADELDDLTARIAALTKAMKIAGVYDASIPELQRIFQEGKENELVGVANMAEFSQKAGADGMGVIWLVPLRDLAFALLELYKARDQVKQIIYEITGIGDIVRGQGAEGGAKTATEQRIKGQFASMRLNDMQSEVARFARDTLRIMGEIISEHYSPETLYLVSGFEQYAKEQWPAEHPPPTQGQPPGQPGMGHNGGPSMPMGGVATAGMPAVDPVQASRAKGQQMFQAAVALLKNDKLRGFRIDIETDSLIEPDQQETQRARTELLGAISQFLPQAIEAGTAVPQLKPLMARLLMFFLRGFKASRDIEAAFEQFIDDVTKEAANPAPKPPTPEEIKMQGEMMKQKMEGERAAAQFQMDQQKAAIDMRMAQQENDMEMQRMQAELEIERQRLELEREKLGIEREKAQMGLQVEQQKAAIQGQAAERDAQIDERAASRDEAMAESAAERDAETDERKSELAVETAEAKAKQAAAKPRGAK